MFFISLLCVHGRTRICMYVHVRGRPEDKLKGHSSSTFLLFETGPLIGQWARLAPLISPLRCTRLFLSSGNLNSSLTTAEQWPTWGAPLTEPLLSPPLVSRGLRSQPTHPRSTDNGQPTCRAANTSFPTGTERTTGSTCPLSSWSRLWNCLAVVCF